MHALRLDHVKLLMLKFSGEPSISESGVKKYAQRLARAGWTVSKRSMLVTLCMSGRREKG